MGTLRAAASYPEFWLVVGVVVGAILSWFDSPPPPPAVNVFRPVHRNVQGAC